jgi:hypothetical protein
MNFLVTFEGGDGMFSKGTMTNIYGVSNGVESGLVERTRPGPIRPFMRFYGNGNNTDRSGDVLHDPIGPDFVSKVYPTINDMLENEGRSLLLDYSLRLRKPVIYKYEG